MLESYDFGRVPVANPVLLWLMLEVVLVTSELALAKAFGGRFLYDTRNPVYLV
jgi:hypothetical protein